MLCYITFHILFTICLPSEGLSVWNSPATVPSMSPFCIIRQNEFSVSSLKIPRQRFIEKSSQ